MSLQWDDPRLSRLVQKLVDARVNKAVTKKTPERHYGTVVLVDEDDREVTVRQQRGALTVDTPHIGFGSFTPVVGQRVGYTQWRETGDSYVDLAVDPVTLDQQTIDTSGLLPLSRIRLWTQTIATVGFNEALLVTVTWDTPFADTNYLVFPSIEELNVSTGPGTGLFCQVNSHTEADAVIRVVNSTTSDRTPVLNVLAIHS